MTEARETLTEYDYMIVSRSSCGSQGREHVVAKEENIETQTGTRRNTGMFYHNNYNKIAFIDFFLCTRRCAK